MNALLGLLSIALASPPDAPVLVSPADGTTLPANPTLVVQVSDPDGDPLTVTFEGRPHQDPGADFTIVALPDTQYYACGCSGGSVDTFPAQTSWVAEQITALNVVYVAQLGDCVDSGDDDESQWQVADLAFSQLEEDRSTYALPDGGLPYGIAVGNHDQTPMGSADGTTLYYNLYFGASRFAGTPWYGGYYGDDYDNHYDLFEAGGQGFIAIYFAYDTSPDSAILDWADALLDTYADRQAIVVSHYLLGSDGEFSTQGQAIYDALSDHANLGLMLAGHVSDEARRTDTALRPVHTLLSDYQARSGGGDGWLRILSFSPALHSVNVSTYSPTLDAWEDDEDSTFDLEWDPNPLPFDVIGVTSPSGGLASQTWTGLGAGQSWDWRVQVSDGTDTVVGGPWTLRVGEAAGDSGETGEPVGDSGETAQPVSGESGESGVGDSQPADSATAKVSPSACGCATTRPGPWPLAALLALASRRRRA